jgi:ribosomal protein L37AE/L43A
MPTREEEYWAGQREGKGQGLCPFCGSAKIYYSKYINYWVCNKCLHKFPTPSYGGGKSLEESAAELKARYLTEQEAVKRIEFQEAARKKREELERETSQAKHPQEPKSQAISPSKYKSRIIYVTIGLVLLFIGVVTPFIWPVYFILAIPFIPVPYIGNVFLIIIGLTSIYMGLRGEVD